MHCLRQSLRNPIEPFVGLRRWLGALGSALYLYNFISTGEAAYNGER